MSKRPRTSIIEKNLKIEEIDPDNTTINISDFIQVMQSDLYLSSKHKTVGSNV